MSLLAQGVATGLFGLVPSRDPASNIVDVGYAKYRGNLTYSDTVAYLGIPYAELPVGDRRWRTPLQLNTARVTRELGDQVVNATTYPNSVFKAAQGTAMPEVQEAKTV